MDEISFLTGQPSPPTSYATRLVAGGALFVVPDGIVQAGLLFLRSVVLGTVVLGQFRRKGISPSKTPSSCMRCPGWSIFVPELVGGEGRSGKASSGGPMLLAGDRWYHLLLGIPVLVLGALLTLGGCRVTDGLLLAISVV